MNHIKPTVINHFLKTPTTERGRARWFKIVESASRLFEERGFVNVTLADVIEKSGGSLTTLYKWFGNKEELFLGVFCVRINEVCNRIQSLNLSGKTIEDDFIEMIETLASNIPVRLARVALLESGVFTNDSSEKLKIIEEKTNAPIQVLFRQIREKHNVEFNLNDREMAYLYTRYIRGMILELTLDAETRDERLFEGKRVLKDVLMTLVKVREGGRP